MENINIHNLDCFDFFKDYESKKENKINLCILDLPYGYGHTDCDWDVAIDLKKMWEYLKKICMKNCIYLFFCTTRFGYELIKSNKSFFRYDIVWEKKNCVGFLSVKKAPLRKHEMIYLFSDSTPSYDITSNNEIREYSKKLFEFINKPLKQIFTDFGNRKTDHFFRYNSLQFGIPTQNTYNKLDELYNIKTFDKYKTYDELKKLFVKIGISSKIYNAQKIKVKKFTHNKMGSIHSSIYTKEKRIYCEDVKEERTERFPQSIIKYGLEKCQYKHPTRKPLQLIEYLINTYSNKNDLIMDFTMGSGTVGIGCINTGRRFIGIEKDKEIYETAKNRINEHIKNK